MAMTANRTLQYSAYIGCSCAATAYTYTPGFDVKALAVTLCPSGAVPAYVSLSGTATTADCYLSTGQQIWWPSLPSATNTVSVISTSSGAEISLTVFG